ncbi:coiled-coil domain-containing protein 201 isoform X1 [Canis lupus baileyi]|uniref:coiled-coil domain-containing protein 201 isoform X1 n=2 Tax=Canis lupus TaxID=9612 RepID=UPI0003AE6B67|nr:coiled-coil domain-containing protein 201 isoform X1 [Canis lupus dingo]
MALRAQGTGARPVSSNGDPYTFPALSDAEEDEAPSLTMGQQRWGEAVKHSTPQEGSPRLRRRPPGEVPSRQGEGPEPWSRRPARAPRSTPSLRAGPGRSAPLQTPRLSNGRASRAARGQPGPRSGHPAPKEDPPAQASVTRQQHAESCAPRSWPGPTGLPGIPSAARRRRRDPEKMAAERERVRQWEARQLWDIEEATQHELTLQDE